MIYSLSDSVNKLFYANYSIFADHVIGTYSTSDYPIEILLNIFYTPANKFLYSRMVAIWEHNYQTRTKADWKLFIRCLNNYKAVLKNHRF